MRRGRDNGPMGQKIGDRHFARADEGGIAAEKAQQTSAPPINSIMPPQPSIPSKGTTFANIGRLGKCTILARPTLKKSRPVTIRRMLLICAEYESRNSCDPQRLKAHHNVDFLAHLDAGDCATAHQAARSTISPAVIAASPTQPWTVPRSLKIT